MKETLKYGHVVGQIMQVCHVVEDLQASIATWASRLNVGPWFVMEHFELLNKRYYGEHTEIDINLAVAYSGSLCVELIQQINDVPSVYLDSVARKGYGQFHHWGISTKSFETDVARYEAMGYKQAFYGEIAVAGGAKVVYMDSKDEVGGYIELFEVTPEFEEMNYMVYRAAQNWDGKVALYQG